MMWNSTIVLPGSTLHPRLTDGCSWRVLRRYFKKKINN